MEQPKSDLLISCPDHKDQPLVRVNPDPTAQKHVYCVECLGQTEDSKALEGSSQKITEFLDSAAVSFAEIKGKIQPASEPSNMAARQAKSFEELSNLMAQMKDGIDAFLEDIKNGVIDALDKKKKEHLEALDNQLTIHQDNYAFFEKKILYPNKDDIENMLPSKEVLDERLEKVSTADELDKLIQDTKQNLEANKDQKRYSEEFSEYLKTLEDNLPILRPNKNLETAKDEFIDQVNQNFALDKFLYLENPLPFTPSLFPQSTILSMDDSLTLKEWLPKNIRFDPKLLFKMTRQGKDSKKFHSRCDKKGPTIMLIKCRYENAKHNSIIGAFLNRGFEVKEGWQKAGYNFLFSLTPKIKCPISLETQYQYAINYDSSNNIQFGYQGNIAMQNFESFYSYMQNGETTYENCDKMIPTESWKGFNERHNFIPEEIEVYALTKRDDDYYSY